MYEMMALTTRLNEQDRSGARFSCAAQEFEPSQSNCSASTHYSAALLPSLAKPHLTQREEGSGHIATIVLSTR